MHSFVGHEETQKDSAAKKKGSWILSPEIPENNKKVEAQREKKDGLISFLQAIQAVLAAVPVDSTESTEAHDDDHKQNTPQPDFEQCVCEILLPA